MKKLNTLGMYWLGRLHGYMASLLFDIRLWRWKLVNGFPSKETIASNLELQDSLADIMFKGVSGRVLEAEVIIINLFSMLHDIIQPSKEYADGSMAVASVAVFNSRHPDFNSVDVKLIINPDVPLEDRVIRLVRLIDKYNGWKPGTLIGRVQYFAYLPAYEKLIAYFQQHGLPGNTSWLNTNAGERK